MGRMRRHALRALLAIAVLGLSLGARSWPQEHDRAAPAPTSPDAPPAEARIDINHAGENQLMKVPGMTRPWAARIVRFRPYRTKQDLLDRGVVTAQVYDRIKDFVIAHREQ
jgi:DNA uptake protein ComE-like DNA-binding protein